MNKIKHDAEYLDIVNDNDEVVGRDTYEKVYEALSPLRIVHVYIYNAKGQLLIQQRTFHKPLNGGTWMMSAGGHVQSGESYKIAAERELKEELGIDVPLVYKWKDTLANHLGHKKFFAIFEGKSNKKTFKFNSIETQQIAWKSLEEIKEMIRKGEPMHPEFLAELKNHFGF